MNKKNLTICVAGHIDHGKTTLVKQLTGKDLDTLKEEKARQISVNIGFAFLENDDFQIGLIDLPGHEKFIKNMIAGVNNVQAAILVVACDDGVMPQTLEHLNILKLLGVQEILLVLSKTDLVDEPRINEVEKDLKTLLKQYQFHQFSKALVNKNDWQTYALVKAQIFSLGAMINNLAPTGDFRLDIDRVFNLPGKGTVITGTTKNGPVFCPDSLNLAPLNLSVEVKEIQTNEKTVLEAYPGQRTALRISGVDYQKVHRGFVVYKNESLKIGPVFDGILTFLTPFSNLKKQQVVTFFAGTRKFLAKLKILGSVAKSEILYYCQILKITDELYFSVEEKGLVKFETDEKIQTGFQILRLGEIVFKKQIPEYCQELEVLRNGDLKSRAFLKLKKSVNLFTDLTQGLKDLSLVDFQNNSDFLIIDSQAIHQTNYQKWAEKVLAYLTNFHQKNPLLLGVSFNSLYQNFKQELRQKTDCQLLLQLMQQNNLIKYDRGNFALKRYDVILTDDQTKLKKFILKRIKEDGFKVKNIEKLATKAVDEKVFKMMLKYLVNLKSIVMLDHGFYVAKNNFDRSLVIMEEWMKTHQEVKINDLEEILKINSEQAMLFWTKYLDLKVLIKNGSSYIINKKSDF